MLHVLYAAERELPSLLRHAPWQSVFVDYEEPYVERLFVSWDEYRVYLHRIHLMRSRLSIPLFHPHPWPSAMKVISGKYEMAIGYGEGQEKPPVASRLILPSESYYEMKDKNAWHSVRPIGSPSLSLMVTGKPWERWSPKSDRKMRELTEGEKQRLLKDFLKFYP